MEAEWRQAFAQNVLKTHLKKMRQIPLPAQPARSFLGPMDLQTQYCMRPRLSPPSNSSTPFLGQVDPRSIRVSNNICGFDSDHESILSRSHLSPDKWEPHRSAVHPPLYYSPTAGCMVERRHGVQHFLYASSPEPQVYFSAVHRRNLLFPGRFYPWVHLLQLSPL